MRNMLRLLLVALVALPSVARAQLSHEGWWVVVASIPDDDTERMDEDHERINAAAADCGFTTFNDFSAKFSGFRPGYNVFVIGAYERRSQAERVRDLVEPCLPGAYLKRGRYSGE